MRCKEVLKEVGKGSRVVNIVYLCEGRKIEYLLKIDIKATNYASFSWFLEWV